MIEVSRGIPVNEGSDTPITVDQLWEGLLEKAGNPMLYVKSITACTVTDEFDNGLVRDIIHAGKPVREVVTWYPKRRVHFVRTHGSARGTIDNEIELAANGDPILKFTFRIVVDNIEHGSPEEAAFATRMEEDYLDSVQTTIQAVRARVRAGAAS